MKLLMLVYGLIEQGAYWRAYRLGECLAQSGLDVTLLATSRQRRTGMHERLQAGMRLVETPDLFQGSLRRSGWDPWNTLNRIAWLRGRKFDLVHSFELRPTAAIPTLVLSRTRHIPWISDWGDWFGRGGSIEERPNRLVRAILRPPETYFEENVRRQASGATAICTTLRERLLQMGFQPEDILLLPNGADLEKFTPIPVSQARSKLGLDPDRPLIGYVGSIFRRDALLMAHSFDELSRQLPEAGLVIAGYCPTNLKDLVQSPDAVLQTGYTDVQTLQLTLSACDLFWLPLSDTNANRGRFPLKLTDYMALGRPIVATPVGDIRDVFSQAKIGLLAPAVPQPFAEATLSLLQNPALRAELGQQARRLAETHYRWSQLAERLLAFYLSVLKRKQPAGSPERESS
jgi:glycosyltransferase involved in cell wall biosynthesis